MHVYRPRCRRPPPTSLERIAEPRSPCHLYAPNTCSSLDGWQVNRILFVRNLPFKITAEEVSSVLRGVEGLSLCAARPIWHDVVLRSYGPSLPCDASAHALETRRSCRALRLGLDVRKVLKWCVCADDGSCMICSGGTGPSNKSGRGTPRKRAARPSSSTKTSTMLRMRVSDPAVRSTELSGNTHRIVRPAQNSACAGARRRSLHGHFRQQFLKEYPCWRLLSGRCMFGGGGRAFVEMIVGVRRRQPVGFPRAGPVSHRTLLSAQQADQEGVARPPVRTGPADIPICSSHPHARTHARAHTDTCMAD